MSARGVLQRSTAAWLVAAIVAATSAASHAADEPLAAALKRDGWLVYAVPLAAGAVAPCCYSGWRKGRVERQVCTLERNGFDGIFGTLDDERLRSRARALMVHLKIADGAVRQVLAVGDDCPVDPGRAEVRALDGVSPAASAALLLDTARRGRESLADDALQALTLHEQVGTDALLAVARDPTQPPPARRKAFFWLGQSEDPRAFAELERLLTR